MFEDTFTGEDTPEERLKAELIGVEDEWEIWVQREAEWDRHCEQEASERRPNQVLIRFVTGAPAPMSLRNRIGRAVSGNESLENDPGWDEFVAEHPDLDNAPLRPSDEAIIEVVRRIVYDKIRPPYARQTALAFEIVNALYPNATEDSRSERAYIAHRLTQLAKSGRVVRLRAKLSPGVRLRRWTLPDVDLDQDVSRYWEAF